MADGSDSLAGKACESDSAIDLQVDSKHTLHGKHGRELLQAWASYGVQESLAGGGELVLRKCPSAHVASTTTDAPVHSRGNLAEAVHLDYKGCITSLTAVYRQDVSGSEAIMTESGRHPLQAC